MQPVSAAGGAVKVEDEIAVEYHLVGKPDNVGSG